MCTGAGLGGSSFAPSASGDRRESVSRGARHPQVVLCAAVLQRSCWGDTPVLREITTEGSEAQSKSATHLWATPPRARHLLRILPEGAAFLSTRVHPASALKLDVRCIVPVITAPGVDRGADAGWRARGVTAGAGVGRGPRLRPRPPWASLRFALTEGLEAVGDVRGRGGRRPTSHLLGSRASSIY